MYLHIRRRLILLFKGRAMVQVASRRPLTAKVRVHSYDSPWEICGGQSGTGTGDLSCYNTTTSWRAK
jgi:hypothetical protein